MLGGAEATAFGKGKGIKNCFLLILSDVSSNFQACCAVPNTQLLFLIWFMFYVQLAVCKHYVVRAEGEKPMVMFASNDIYAPLNCLPSWQPLWHYQLWSHSYFLDLTGTKLVICSSLSNYVLALHGQGVNQVTEFKTSNPKKLGSVSSSTILHLNDGQKLDGW